jgi:G3E family GTPase
MIAPVDSVLLTGFLGAGKTTLLQFLLDHELFAGKKIAVLVNEFGKLRIDGALLPPGDHFLTEINNGSIFCSCVKGSLIESLENTAREFKPDLMLIEATGLAEPTDVTALFQTDFLRTAYRRPLVIAVADAVNFPKLKNILPALTAQVKVADIILVNKCDLAASGEPEKVEKMLREINSHAKIYHTEHCRFPLELSEKSSTESPDMTVSELGIAPEAVENYELRWSGKIDRNEFYNVMEEYRTNILRAKGLVKFPDRTIYFESVNGILSSKPASFTLDAVPETAMSFVLRGISPGAFDRTCNAFKK